MQPGKVGPNRIANYVYNGRFRVALGVEWDSADRVFFYAGRGHIYQGEYEICVVTSEMEWVGAELGKVSIPFCCSRR